MGICMFKKHHERNSGSEIQSSKPVPETPPPSSISTVPVSETQNRNSRSLAELMGEPFVTKLERLSKSARFNKVVCDCEEASLGMGSGESPRQGARFIGLLMKSFSVRAPSRSRSRCRYSYTETSEKQRRGLNGFFMVDKKQALMLRKEGRKHNKLHVDDVVAGQTSPSTERVSVGISSDSSSDLFELELELFSCDSVADVLFSMDTFHG